MSRSRPLVAHSTPRTVSAAAKAAHPEPPTSGTGVCEKKAPCPPRPRHSMLRLHGSHPQQADNIELLGARGSAPPHGRGLFFRRTGWVRAAWRGGGPGVPAGPCLVLSGRLRGSRGVGEGAFFFADPGLKLQRLVHAACESG